MLQHKAVVRIPDAPPTGRGEQTAGHAAAIAGDESVANDARRSSAMSEDDLRVAKIHHAVVAGDLKRILASICKFLEC